MPIHSADFYKIGVVVDDLDAAVHEFSLTYDYEWLHVPAAPYPYMIGGEVRKLTLNAVLSRQQPRLHILQSIPGTPWMAAQRNAIHHVAYWVDDFAAACTEMSHAGYTIECSDVTSTRVPQLWAYFNNDRGMRVELLNRPSFPGHTAMLDTLPLYRTP